MSTSSSSFTVREGQLDDLPTIHGMILDLMQFQKLTVTPLPLERLIKDSGLSPDYPNKYFHLIVAQNNQSEEILGYLLYYFMIKTSAGKFVYIEDIFVKETARKSGVGSALIKNAATQAIKTESAGMKLQVRNVSSLTFLLN